ncbi:hypothetical protein [Burkholderia multivorans]|uniref:hypothetical protein n=1 Tax=Burkholderia multivorans TaxID=87883 RepID=UPI0004F6178A|nr:hypothetical protein [Burkholderia multivorans]AIO73208.1 hypothetical protein DM80_4353 [Burkholderia multivorans]KGB90001.1 hypothetical protein DM81_209 [Burkholderia multivorans]MBU9388793.1 hypothetical protein [Burkholderia multivorans]MBU9517605.1 hypothetical protein [Burkholderia multivorans]MBU9560071.1 hypothetical protein [Burkholderia multivorans]
MNKNIQNPMTVPGDDSLRSFGAKLANLLGAGRLDRKAAQCMHQHASTTLAGIAGSLEKAKGAAKAAFDEYHDYKDRIYREKVVGFTGVYKLLALSRSTHYVPAESEALKLPLTPDVPAVRALPSSAGKVILALCLGGVLGGAVGYGLEATGIVVGLNALAVIAIPAALAAIASAMVGGVSAAAKQREAAHEFLEDTAMFMTNADQHIRDLEMVPTCLALLKDDIEQLESTLDHMVEQQLDPILEDASNACQLLTDLIDTPLLDGEGALMDGVIEKVQAYRRSVGAMQDRLAT